MKEIISTSAAPAAIGPYSQAVRVGNTVYTSGQIALDPKSGALVGDSIAEQTEQIMKNLAAVLAAAGSSLDNVIKTTCFITDMADFAEFNKIYEKHIKCAPARSCVAVSALPKGALAEVELVAFTD